MSVFRAALRPPGKVFAVAAGFRAGELGKVYWQNIGEKHVRPLEIHTEAGAAYPKSPDGHGWGYSGSGPAQLALDLLWEVYGAQPSAALYQRFKETFVAKIDQNAGWTVDEDQIRAIVDHLGGWQPAARDYAFCPESSDGQHFPVPAAVHDTEMPDGYFTVECLRCHQTTGHPMPEPGEIRWD